MQTVALGDTGTWTTRLGFGCSSLLGSMDRRASLATLEAAFDAGIRHFDVAPSYGYGEAESCLGEFLRRHPGQTSVTTKFGIAPPARQSLVGMGRGLVRPIIRLLPGAKQALAQTASRVTRPVERSRFLPAPASESLERSLIALQTDHLNLWLLHEVEAGDLGGSAGDDLLEFLQGAKTSGKIGGFGIASGGTKVPALIAEQPAFCSNRQYEWSVLDRIPPEDGSFRLHHRALTDNFRTLHAELVAHPQRAEEWSQSVGFDLGKKEQLAELMLAAAMVLNPGSVILFSSKSAAHIAGNGRLLQSIGTNEAMETAAERLYALVQAERASLFAADGVLASRAPARVAR